MEAKIAGIKIKGIAAVVPAQTIPMSNFYDQFGEQEVKRIVMSTGIESIYVADHDTRASDLCESAAVALLNALDISRDSIDAIVFVSQTPNFKMPATSCVLQHRLGLKKTTVAFDINYGCSGYIYGLYQAAMLLQAGGCNRVLLCVGDTITHHLDPVDHKVRLVFGDAGTATCIERGNDTWAFDIRTDGSGYRDLMIDKNTAGHDEYLFMNGGAIMEFVLREVKPVFDNVLALRGWEKNELSQVVLHQANQFILNYLRKKLSLDSSVVPIAVKNYGNTGPASIPLTLCDRYHNKILSLGKSVFSGFGVGLSWGAVALDLTDCQLLEVIKL